VTVTAETHPFQAEVSQVLSLVVNSLYTHKEVFLRELVSNASDALDQLSFKALTNPDLTRDDPGLEIEIVPDKTARTLTIRDAGIGMSKDDLVKNLGTIAHSGTRKLIESLSGDQRKDVSLIGQFGVGFYAGFLVAERVEVVSRAAGSEEAWKWESTADGGFTVETAERDRRGTDVILHLRKDEDDFLREWTLRDLVRKYSDYVRHGIFLTVERTEPVGEETDDDGEPRETRTVTERERVNQEGALWRRPKGDITDEQYTEFYKHLTHDWNAPLANAHFAVEGTQEMTGLLFIPSRAEPRLFGQKAPGLRLFVKRVFILEDAEELVPEWLRFLRGVIDSEDLPLNVSREFLQKDRVSSGIRKQVVKHALRLLESLVEEEEAETAKTSGGNVGDEDENAEASAPKRRYTQFWNLFGRVLKEGVHYDFENKERVSKLLRYPSSRDQGLTSLAAYVERMPEGQESIYYICAENEAAAANSPHIEALRARGFEVLYMLDTVDEWVVQALSEFDDKSLVSAAKGALDLPVGDDEKKAAEERKDEFSGLIDRMKSALTSGVKEVRLSQRLTESPACLVSDPHGLSPHMERLMRANNQPVPEQKRILELNPGHVVVQRLQSMAADDARADEVASWSQLLYDQALVAEGSPPSDPSRFARQITDLLDRATAG
jgi:molecular chaperone HtpG